MTDPLTDLLAELAPSVDARAAREAFDATRRQRRRRRRAVVGALAAVVAAAGATAVVLINRDDPGTVATSDEPSTVAPPPAPTTTTSATSTTATTTTSPATTVPPTTIAAPLLAVDGCPPIAASDLRTSSSWSLFGRTTPDGLPIQAIATNAGIEGPYAVVLRYQSAIRPPSFGDPVDINGHDGRVLRRSRRARPDRLDPGRRQRGLHPLARPVGRSALRHRYRPQRPPRRRRGAGLRAHRRQHRRASPSSPRPPHR